MLHGRKSLMAFGRTLLLLALALGHTSAAPVNDPADQAMAAIRPDSIRANMRYLADDLLEGRGTATRGHEIAARFLATRFEALGLEPAGDDGTYLQKVPLVSLRVDETRTTFALGSQSLVFRADYIASGDPARDDVSVEAPVVFVGFGVTAPDQKYDDYSSIDATGKIVAFLYGAPNFESSLKAHYSSLAIKSANAAAHGALGIIVLDDPMLERMYSFSHRVRDLATPQFRWLGKQGLPNDYFPQLKCRVSLGLEATRRFFDGSPHTAAEIFEAAKAGRLMSFPLPFTAKIHTVTTRENVQSPNVVAKLTGSDPSLRNEYLVYTAHLDHLGIGEAVQGDKIYNGALDNASGSAALLELAQAFSGMKTKPRRSILFVSVTAEEAGLLGSDYFAHFPPVSRQAIVADLNLDEILMFWTPQDIIAFGAEHSSLDGVIRSAARRMHLEVSPDPLPEQVVFIRSDQYSFVKQGIPAVMPTIGFSSSDPKISPGQIFMKWEQTRYHQPQDDMQQPGLNFDAAATFVRFVFLCGYSIAQDKQRPTWNKNDFFGDHYAKPSN